MRWHVVSVGWALALATAAAAGAGSATEPAPDPGPAIVLELFTSQGCSSCPPAERVLNQLGLDEKTRGRVVPLAFHVDYWDAGGWVDPFSAREWTARQLAYDHALGDGMYTPQLVVNGSVQFPGGNEPRALAEIASALASASLVRVALTARKGESGPPALTVKLTAEVTENVATRKLQVFVALFESRLTTAVARGENGGRTLESGYVVRRLETALSLAPKAGTRKQGSVAFKLDRAWKPENIGVAAFVQDPGSMRIYGAATLPAFD